MAIAPGIKDISQNIVSSYDTRMAELGRLKKGAKEMLSGFQTSHTEMGTQLRKDLGQGEAERKRANAELKKELTKGVTTRKSEVKGMLNKFRTSQEEIGSALRQDLAEHTQGIREEAAKIRQEARASHEETSAQLRKELADYNRGIKSKVAGMRQEIMADLKKAKTAWQELASTMRERKGSAKGVQSRGTTPAVPIPKSLMGKITGRNKGKP